MNVIWLYRVVWCYGIQLKIYGGPDVPEQTSNVEGYEERVGNSCDLTWDLTLSSLWREGSSVGKITLAGGTSR